MTVKLQAQVKLFNGEVQRYTHHSDVLNCEMTFSVYMPPAALLENKKVPVLFWLSGLTCTDENFMQKAGAQRLASELGMMIVAPDTSPRGEGVPDDPEGAYDFGLGAGFYVNATEEPFKKNYQMYDYIVQELPDLVNQHLPSNGRFAISGHSMGGHGALVIGLRNPDLFRSISAFSPICNPSDCPWGQKALGNYLGGDQAAWADYDATLLLEKINPKQPILIDQGTMDQFLEEQLKPKKWVDLSHTKEAEIIYRFQEGYDHSYYFIATFIEDHLRFHANHLKC
jgi:S-formylglutathione hydrolase